MRNALNLSASISILLLFGAQIAQAVEFAQRDPEFPPRDYTCRFDGTDVPLGARRCLKTPQGERPAECGIAGNMSTWRPVGDRCL